MQGIGYNAIWKVRHLREGREIWSDWRHNSITLQGENAILQSFFRSGIYTPPANFYMRFANVTWDKTSTLANVAGEPGGNGYAAQPVTPDGTGFPIIDQDPNTQDWRITSQQIQITAAGGTIGPINTLFMATSIDNSGLLLAFLTLSISRTLQDGDTMQAQMRIRLIPDVS